MYIYIYITQHFILYIIYTWNHFLWLMYFSYAPPCRKPDEARAASVAQQAEVAVHARQAAEVSGREGGGHTLEVKPLLGPRVVGFVWGIFLGDEIRKPSFYRDYFINHDIKDPWIPKILWNEWLDDVQFGWWMGSGYFWIGEYEFNSLNLRWLSAIFPKWRWIFNEVENLKD